MNEHLENKSKNILPFTGDLLIDMEIVRMTCERIHAERKRLGIPVRQALASASVKWTNNDLLIAFKRAYHPR